jgi:hypothetical protein
MRLLIIFSLILFPLGKLSAQETMVSFWLEEGTVLCSLIGECMTAPEMTSVSMPCFTHITTGEKHLGPLLVPLIRPVKIGILKTTYSYDETFYLQEFTPCPEQI